MYKLLLYVLIYTVNCFIILTYIIYIMPYESVVYSMYSKDYCRDYINEKKRYLNLASICRELNIKQPHVSQFLKSNQFNMFITLENANRLVSFIENL